MSGKWLNKISHLSLMWHITVQFSKFSRRNEENEIKEW